MNGLAMCRAGSMTALIEAASIVIVLPPRLAFVFAQRYFIQASCPRG